MATPRDPILDALVEEAAGDSETVGLLLSGSRAAGQATPSSDYDLFRVLSDVAHERRQADGVPLRERRERPGQPYLDLVYICQNDLDRLPETPGWWTYGYATARVLVDKTGAVTRALQAIKTMPPEKAQADVAGWFDAYANALLRSVKAARRGDELGARLQAADSAMHLMRTLFSLERRWTPYHDRLAASLPLLAGQGWPDGYLHDALLALVSMGDPERQLELAGRVEALLRSRGFESTVAAWTAEIDRLRTSPG
jgi:hypothetical protein